MLYKWEWGWGKDSPDWLHVYASVQHVAVYCKGVMYKVNVYDHQRRILAPQTLEQMLDWIVKDAENYQGKY